MRTRLSLFAATATALLTVLTPACSDDPVTPGTSDTGSARPDATAQQAEAGARDATALDSDVVDTGTPAADTGTPDTGGALDASVDGGAAEDAMSLPADAMSGPIDASAPYDGGSACEFLDLDIFIVRCGNRPSYLRGFREVNMQAGCLPFWTLEGGTFTSSTAAVAGASCSPSCLYRAGTSVSFIDHCGRRNGYIVFVDDRDPVACPDLYEFSSGLFPSREAWENDTPCPDAGP